MGKIFKFNESEVFPKIELPGHEGRVGYFQHLVNGRKFFPLDPRPEELFIEDIAWALGNICRYNGHTRPYYSVAEHSVHISHLVKNPAHRKTALMHDAPEFSLGDWIRPMKRIPVLAMIYGFYEDRVMKVIAEKYGLIYPFPQSILDADEAMATREMNTLFSNPVKGNLHIVNDDAAHVRIQGWSPREAGERFLNRWRELQADEAGL